MYAIIQKINCNIHDYLEKTGQNDNLWATRIIYNKTGQSWEK